MHSPVCRATCFHAGALRTAEARRTAPRVLSFRASAAPIVIPSKRSPLRSFRASAAPYGHSERAQRVEESALRSVGIAALPHDSSPSTTSKGKNLGAGVQPVGAPQPCSVLPKLRGSAVLCASAWKYVAQWSVQGFAPLCEKKHVARETEAERNSRQPDLAVPFPTSHVTV